MRMQSSVTLSFSGLAFGAVAAVASGQAVYVVDDDGGPGVSFTDIPPAISAAADGDTVLVRDGSYSGFTIDGKGVAVVADIGATPDIDSTITVQSLALSKAALIRGLETAPGSLGEGIVLQGNAGPVRIEGCRFTGQDGHNIPANPHPEGFAGARVSDSTNVVFTRSEIAAGAGANQTSWNDQMGAGGSGLATTTSKVSLYDSSVTGGDGGSDWGGLALSGHNGGRGGSIFTTQLFVSGSTITGGGGGHGGSDWTWGGCGSGGWGGAGLYLFGAQLIERDSEIVGGPPGFGVTYYGCSNGLPGPDLTNVGSVVDTLPFPARHFEAPPALRENVPASLSFGGEVGDGVLLLVSGAGGYTFVPGAAGVLATDAAPIVAFMGVVPSSQELVVPVKIQQVPAGLQSARVHAQAAFVAHGVGTLGANSTFVLLGPDF